MLNAIVPLQLDFIMEAKEQIKLKFHGVDIPVVLLNSEKSKAQSDSVEISVSISAKAFYPKENENWFKIVQEINLSCQDFFNLSVVGVGSFELANDIDQNIRKSFININAPAIMFPYMRSFISTLTSNIGNVTGAIVLPPHFFKGNLDEIDELPLFK